MPISKAYSTGNKPNEIVSVVDLGAVGNGVNDDTAAIQAALDSGANKILFPKPSVNYLITDQVGGYALTVTNAGQVLEGDGMDLSILDYNSSTTARPAILVAANDVQIKNLQIDGSTNSTNAGTGTAANCNGIQVTNVDGCLVSEVKIKGGHIGIHFENDTGAYANNKDNRAYKCVIRNTASSGIEVSRGENIQIEGNNAKDAGTDGFKISDYSRYCQVIGNMATDCTRDGFDFFDGFIDSVAANNVAEGNTLQGFEVKGTFDGSNYVVRDSTFIGNMARGNGTSGFLFQSLRNINSVGNKAVSNATSGFFFNNVQGGTFSSDHASKNTQHGFFFNGSESRTQLVGCYAIDNSWDDGTTQNGTYDGFFLNSGSTIHFVGCSAINGTTSGERGGQGYGISLNSAGSAIVGGYFSSNVTGDVENQTNAKMVAVRDNAGIYMNAFGSWSSNADAAVNGYVEFVDDAGITRKLATIA